MIVKCIYNQGENLKSQSIIAGNNKDTEFNLKINNNYVIYGICVYKGSIKYLINPSSEYYVPLWYPAELFEIVDDLFPIEWYFNFFGYDSDTLVIWGYKELAFNIQHNDGIIEREDDAMQIFIKRKKEIDEYYDL